MKIVRIQSHEVDNCFKENSNQDLPCSQCDGIMLESDYVWTVAKEEGFHFCSLQCLQDYFELNKPFNQMNGYKAFYKNKEIEVFAKTSYEAQQVAAKQFKAKKSYQVSVMLCEVNKKQVVHNPAII